MRANVWWNTEFPFEFFRHVFSEHEDKLWRDTEKFKETIQKKDTELRRNEDAKRKMAADLKSKLQEKERGMYQKMAEKF